MSAGEKTRAAMAAKPEWPAGLPTERRLPSGRWLFTGCGTSFHAAKTGGEAVLALEPGAAESPPAGLADEAIVSAPQFEQRCRHTASYTAAVATLAAMRGEDVSWPPAAVADAPAGPRFPISEHVRGIDPDPVRRDDARWARAREAYA